VEEALKETLSVEQEFTLAIRNLEAVRDLGGDAGRDAGNLLASTFGQRLAAAAAARPAEHFELARATVVEAR
jgi:hypothetical protein